MQKSFNNKQIYSPSDLVTFLECNHATFLDIKHLGIDTKEDENNAMAQLLQKKGIEHELAYLQELKNQNKHIIEIPKDQSLQERVNLTLKAMRIGADAIYQAVFFDNLWRGDADFLIRCNTASALGDYSYEVLDTKLAKTPEAKHVIQLCVYSELLSKLQNLTPAEVHLFLGDGEKYSFKIADFFFYYTNVKRRFEAYVNNPQVDSYPKPCSHCKLCQWQNTCQNQWETDNHLTLVANIQNSQIEKFKKAGIKTVTDLANTTSETKVPDLNRDVFLRLRSQAALQHHKATTGENTYEIIPFLPEKGFNRMPIPDDGDLFFDMEGDPLYPDGLEYLFGIYYSKNSQNLFKPFWAHNHAEEKETFKEFMDFLDDHLTNHPNAYIYHYNHYETTALKRLACRYALYEEKLDNLLRKHKFVDLYLVVRESIRTSESGYSIKNLETFYMNKRANAVATAADSIIVYNKWRETGVDNLLKEIADYNEVDCISTKYLRDWLLKLKPEESTWFNGEQEIADNNQEIKRNEWKIEYENYKNLLEVADNDQKAVYEGLSNLLEFHNREAKPQWWSIFDRRNKLEDELIDDPECLGGLLQVGVSEEEKRSVVYTYSFSPQEYKMRAGSQIVNINSSEKSSGTIVEIDDDSCIIKIKRDKKKDPLPEGLSIGPTGPISSDIIRSAIYRYADHVIKTPDIAHVATELLSRNAPRIKGKKIDEPIITSDNLQDDALKAIAALDNSYLFIQGPPGAGKTYISSHIIVELINQGKKIGIASNSHKAIHNLLDKIEGVAKEKGVRFCGIKKANGSNNETNYEGNFISSKIKTDDMDLNANLFAGTVWTFASPHFDGQLDYLFIDEAGQVAVANVVAMANSTKNIILVGDQMQLGQPIQGTHPGEAGLSILEFLLKDQSTISPERGIFLGQTRRMRPSICSFISNAFYDGRLDAHLETTSRKLVLKNVGLPNEGIVMIPANHEGCSQKSVEEGKIIKDYYQSLLGQSFTDLDGQTRLINENDILVVTPYNVQVNYLRSLLSENAKVGTVDKFQGQEAPIVLISMVTSSAEDLPRNIEFLYSKNRLNVAVSRAQCLAIVVANPKLLEIPCKTVKQMSLVNSFCALSKHSEKI